MKPMYTFGYSGRKIAEIRTAILELDAVLVDIRYSPRSRVPMWAAGSLRKEFGTRYFHLEALGNAAYKSGGPIQIADFELGKVTLSKMGKSCLLMCACKEYGTCHRKTVADMLKAAGFVVEELDFSTFNKPPADAQLKLFE